MMQHIDYNVVLKLISYLTVFNDEFVQGTVTSHVDWMLERYNSHRNITFSRLVIGDFGGLSSVACDR